MPEPKCFKCGRTDFKDWGELAEHKLTAKDSAHKGDRAGKLWAKKYIHRNAIQKLKSIGQKKEFEPRQALTPEQLEAKREAKYTLSGETKFVPVRCPRCKFGRREALPVEHVNCPDALIVDNCYIVLCEGCK